MKKTVLLLAVLVVLPQARGEWKSLVGEQAPALEILSWIAAPEGESLEDLRGRVVVVLLDEAANRSRESSSRRRPSRSSGGCAGGPDDTLSGLLNRPGATVPAPC